MLSALFMFAAGSLAMWLVIFRAPGPLSSLSDWLWRMGR